MFIVTGLLGLTIQTLKYQEWRKFLYQKNVFIAKFSVETRLEYAFPIECMYFQ